jgi:hypothetical protein
VIDGGGGSDDEDVDFDEVDDDDLDDDGVDDKIGIDGDSEECEEGVDVVVDEPDDNDVTKFDANSVSCCNEVVDVAIVGVSVLI